MCCQEEVYDAREIVEILDMIRCSVQNGRSIYTDEIVELVDGKYLDILESMEVA